MPEAISTQNLFALLVTSQELSRGGGGFSAPNQNRTSNCPTIIELTDRIFKNFLDCQVGLNPSVNLNEKVLTLHR